MHRIRTLPLPLLCCMWLALLLPPVRDAMERTMSAHMLVHIPAFIVLGWAAAARLLKRHPALHISLRPYRWAFLVCALFTLGIWMIPRLLDLAAESLWVDALKAISLSVTGGASLCLAWRHMDLVVRGLLHVEAMASLLRLGWLYIESPTRLCTSYGLFDQYRLGKVLLAAGAAYAVWMAWQALFTSTSALTLRRL